jgi:hypothetical protein
MIKNKNEFNAEPKTPKQRAETLLRQAQLQFDRFQGMLPSNIADNADSLIVGGYLVVGEDPFNKPIKPIFVFEGDLPTIVERFPSRKMSFISFMRKNTGETDLLAQLTPVRVDDYAEQMRQSEPGLVRSDVVLGRKEDEPTINGVSVRDLEEISSGRNDLAYSLTRLEQIMGSVEDSTYVSFQKPTH